MHRLFFIVFLLYGCQNVNNDHLTPITLEDQSRGTLEFTGRGAAAGVMMAGSMGAMGVAIGVAIDEGIAKDLHRSAYGGGFNAIDAFKGALHEHGYTAQENAGKTLVIKHLGFRADGDLITPWVECSYVSDGIEKSLSYADVAEEDRVAAELSDLKEKSDLAANLLREAIAATVSNVAAADAD